MGQAGAAVAGGQEARPASGLVQAAAGQRHTLADKSRSPSWLTAGQRHDSPEFQPVLERIGVPRVGVGRPRRRPDQVRADRAYGSRANCDYLRRRGIRCTIPERSDQIRNRKKPGAQGGRPPEFDKTDYRERHAAGCGISRVRDQPPQAPSVAGREVRQTRRPLRGHRHHRSHQRVALTSTFKTLPS
jgi:hypothetical protein